MDSDMKARRAAYDKAYRAAHFDEIKTKKAAYYAANPERQNEPKRKAKFDSIEKRRKAKCEAKGEPFFPREYVAYKTVPMTDEQYLEIFRVPRPAR